MAVPLIVEKNFDTALELLEQLSPWTSSWLDGAGRTRDDVARELGVAPQHLDRLGRGTSRPSLELAVAIEKVTRGAIPVAEWMNVRVRRDGSA